jgi:magnesium transporter
MPEIADKTKADRGSPRVRVEDALADISALIRKNRLVEGLVHEQAAHAADGEKAGLVESLVTKQNRAALQSRLDRLHPADIAYILEALPLEERLYVWDLIKSAERDGEILVEVSDAVRESLISSMDTEELVAAAETLEADELAAIAEDLPQEVMDDVFRALPVEEREQLRRRCRSRRTWSAR